MESQIKFVHVQHASHFTELMATVKHFAKSGILTDVALLSGSDIFHMHYVIFSCFSSYFDCVMDYENVIYFIHTDHGKMILQTMVDYIYSGAVHVSHIIEHQLQVAATSLQIKNLMSLGANDKESERMTVVCPNYQTHVTQKMWESRQKLSRNDVIFIAENKYKVFAHSFIVGASSSFLLQIFIKYSTQKRKPYIVALPYVRKEILEIVLEFCYKGEVNISPSEIQSVYKVADLMGIKTLCEMLVEIYPDAPSLSMPVNNTCKRTSNIIRNSAVPTALSDLLKQEKLVDVFIFNSEKLFKAHSVILSVYSTYFKQLATYLDYDMKDVIVLTKDIKARNIETMLQYIYTGEVKFEGNAEEFHENMSDWLDLNVLPISSCIIANPDCARVKKDNLNSMMSEKTNTFLETGKRDGKYLESKKCLKKENDVDQNSRNILSENVKLINRIKNVPDLLENEQKDSISKVLSDCAETYLDNKMLETEFSKNDEIMKCDQNVPEYASRNAGLVFNYEDSDGNQNAFILKGDWNNDSNTHTTIVGDKPTCDIHSDNIDSTRSENSDICGEYMGRIEQKLLVPESKGNGIIEGNKNTIYKANEMGDQRSGDIHDTDESKAFFTVKNDILDNNIANAKVIKKLKCQTCLQNFCTPWDFKLHLSIHPKGNILVCSYCQKEFTKSSEMNIHIRSHTGAKPFQCEICGMSFSIRNTLRKHELTHKKEKSKEFQCEICRNTFSRKQYLQEHKRTHSGSKPYECDICHKKFVGKTGLNHHKKTHKSADEKKSAVCEICGKSFTRHALWTHMKYHNKEHECEFCSKSFATTAALKIHVAGAHLGHSWHDCNTCGKGFIRKGHLIRHMKTHEEGKKMTSFSCEKCSSKFKDESHLKAHVKRKHTEQSIQSPTCGICSKHFSTKSALKYHQRLHFHERPHKCNICDKSFAVPYQLRDHIKLHHSEEKQYQCSVCEKKCATQALLNKHLLTHRPSLSLKTKLAGNFVCTFCDKSFTTKLALSNHSRSHSFSRPYQCNLCRKAFRYQDSLLKHLQLHSSDKGIEATQTKELPCIYTIQVCRPSFTSISSSIAGHESCVNEPSNNLVQPVPVIDLNIPEKSGEVSVIQLKPVDEDYLNHQLMETEGAGFMQPLESHSACNVALEKASGITAIPERPYSIIIEENLGCNTGVSSHTHPSITFFPERTELPVPVVDVELPVSSHSLLPVETPSIVVIDSMSISSTDRTTRNQDLNTSLTKDFCI